MVTNTLDSVTFRLKEKQDFSWLSRHGTAFCAFDQTGSGCVCIGTEKDGRKYFCKIAGAGTLEGEVSPEESVRILREAAELYSALAHPALPRVIEHYPHGSLYAVIFEWVDGECLFDHWNFEKYQSDPSLKSPRDRFLALPAPKKLEAVEVLFSFLEHTEAKGYTAVDFYDGSILYDFERSITRICDIDLFRRSPAVNDMGEGWFGTKRLKAPEEYILGSPIDSRTNVFTLGALIFDFFGQFTADDIARRYYLSRFEPCSAEWWQLGGESYSAVLKAVSPERSLRYASVRDFHREWKRAVGGEE